MVNCRVYRRLQRNSTQGPACNRGWTTSFPIWSVFLKYIYLLVNIINIDIDRTLAANEVRVARLPQNFISIEFAGMWCPD